MSDKKRNFPYRVDILESILSSNSSEIIKKWLKRLKLDTDGNKKERLRRMSEFLSTKEGHDKAFDSNISR